MSDEGAQADLAGLEKLGLEKLKAEKKRPPSRN
jgi:hypothetical protein